MIRLALIALFVAGPAQAADMAFFMKNRHSGAMAIELRGDKTIWPGGGQVYLLQSGEQKSVPIDCTAGETICYGAWLFSDDRISFGVGPDNDRNCTACCAVCEARGSVTIDLVP